MATFNRESKTFSELVTFTRASSGWYWDETGTLQEAGTDEPRFDHDPVTGEALGWLIEEQRTNRLLQSVDLTDAAWSKTRVAVTAGETGPDRTASAFLVTPSGTSDIISQAASVSGAEVYTVSAFLKAGTGTEVAVVLTGAVGTTISAYFDLDSGSVTISAGASEVTDATITPQGDGWYRARVSFVTASGGGLVNFRLSSLAEAGATYYAAFPQFELGRTASSPIMTNGAAATRGMDNPAAVLPAAQAQTTGTIYFDFVDVSDISITLSLDRGSPGNRLQVGRSGSGTNRVIAVRASTATLDFSRSDTFKGAISYSSEGSIIAAMNGEPAQEADAGMGSPPTVLEIGHGFDGAAPVTQAWIKEIRMYSRALSADELEELTAL